MTLPPETITALQRVVQNHPALQAKLSRMTDPYAAATLLSDAACRAGVPVERAAILEHYVAAVRRTENAELDDTELDAVAGGVNHGLIIASIASFGLGCAVVSVIYAATGVPRCGA